MTPPFGRPTAAELVEAVREHLDGTMDRAEGDRARFDARVARNALAVVERELRARPVPRPGPRPAAGRTWDSPTTPPWPPPSGRAPSTHDLTGVGRALAAAARDQLLVANPDYLATDAG